MQPDESTEDFGIPLAHRDNDAQMGKSSEGEQNGQEILEEVEEARSNQAVDQDRQRKVGIRPSFIVTSARSYSERGLQGNLEYHAGPLPRLQRPFSRYAC